jgi:hypothetical protein
VRIAVCVMFLLVIMCPAMSAYGQFRGGVYFEDVSVINDGKAVLNDNFNTGKLDDWRVVRPLCTTVGSDDRPPNYCLYMNRLNDINTGVTRKVTCDNVRTLEVKAAVFLPSPQEQWGYTHRRMERTRIDLNTFREEQWFYIAIDLNPGQPGYSVQLVYIKPELHEPCGGGEKYDSRGPVIAPNQWSLVSFKLDPSKKSATVYVNGQAVVSCNYDPSRIHKLTNLDLTTWMGDKEVTAKPGKCINPPPAATPR